MQAQKIREFKGEGDRQYLTGLKLGGERTLILVDRSASMLSDTLVNVIRRRNLPESEQLKSRKWRQVIATVNWLTTQLDEEDQYQIYMFNNTAEPVIRGTEGVWLTADDGVQLNEAVRVLRRTPPKNGTNMHAAFAVAKTAVTTTRQHHPAGRWHADHGGCRRRTRASWGRRND